MSWSSPGVPRSRADGRDEQAIRGLLRDAIDMDPCRTAKAFQLLRGAAPINRETQGKDRKPNAWPSAASARQGRVPAPLPAGSCLVHSYDSGLRVRSARKSSRGGRSLTNF
jgi:hypothetical protein